MGGGALTEVWNKWWKDYLEGNLRNLPLIIVRGVWLARNNSIFKEQNPLARHITVGCTTIYSSILNSIREAPPRPVREEKINEGIPWAYFDGASDQNNKFGAGLVIHLNEHRNLKASVGLGIGTNNFA